VPCVHPCRSRLPPWSERGSPLPRKGRNEIDAYRPPNLLVPPAHRSTVFADQRAGHTCPTQTSTGPAPGTSIGHSPPTGSKSNRQTRLSRIGTAQGGPDLRDHGRHRFQCGRSVATQTSKNFLKRLLTFRRCVTHYDKATGAGGGGCFGSERLNVVCALLEGSIKVPERSDSSCAQNDSSTSSSRQRPKRGAFPTPKSVIESARPYIPDIDKENESSETESELTEDVSGEDED
jgi:hypothetical protein